MNRFIILVLFSLILQTRLFGQIGVHTDVIDPSAILEVTSPAGNPKGVLVPRMTSGQKIAIVNPASGLLVYDTSKRCLSQNVGTEAAPVWICVEQAETTFFCMPSINVLTPNVGATINVDLYQLYRNQFGTPAAGNTTITAGSTIPFFVSTDLYYYITYYDTTVITVNSVSASGVMNYTVNRKADFDTYMNIVFVIK